MGRQIHPAEVESYRILRSRVDLSHLPAMSRAVAERVIHASADTDYAQDLVIDDEAVGAAAGGLAEGAPVVTDAAEVASAITARESVCRIGDPLTERLARTAGITRSAAAVRNAYSEVGAGAVWVIGCAPTALFELISRRVDPLLVIGLPVGFAGAAESKAELRASGLPQVSNISDKGGPDVAAAAFDALLHGPVALS